jgi:hypothetical protein
MRYNDPLQPLFYSHFNKEISKFEIRNSKFYFMTACAIAVAIGVMILSDARPALAAAVRAEAAAFEIAPGAEVAVTFVLDGEGEDMNAVEGAVGLEGSGIEIADVRSGNSDVTLWVEPPAIGGDGSVRFAGIIPGGRSDPARLFRLILRGTGEGSAGIAVRDLRVLLNDGNGTETPSRFLPATILVRRGAPPVPVELVDKDREVPESFVPEIIRDPSLLDGRYVLIFMTQDKGSGMDHYEVFESRRELTLEQDVAWERAESPYGLKDQALKSYVFVKAVDREGNTRIARLEPRFPLAWYERDDILGIMALAALAALFAVFNIQKVPWRGKKKKGKGSR